MTFLHILPCFKRSNDSNFHIPASKLPRFVQNSPVAMHYYHFLHPEFFLSHGTGLERNLQETRGTQVRFPIALCCRDQNHGL